MRPAAWMAGCVVLLAVAMPTCVRAQGSTESYVMACERGLGESLVNGNTEPIYRCLADDFAGIAPDGKAYDRRAALAAVTRVPREYSAVHLDWIQVRVFGDAAVAQGITSWTRRTGTPQRGRWVWTDTWLRRGEHWELVAAEDVQAPPAR